MSSRDKKYDPNTDFAGASIVSHCYPYHGQRQTIFRDAARNAYFRNQLLYGQTAAADSPRHQGGVRGAGASSNKGETKPKARTRHGETAVEYPSNYKGGGARGGGGYYSDEDDDSESEDDDDDESDEKEISRGQGGVRRYDHEANKPEKKGAGSYHDVAHQYEAYRRGARERWQGEYLGYGVRAYGTREHTF
ncbi:uncharacterized protein LOC101768492 isoform X2 [Setaria italica]|uniref:uncharacterized protein LOC101768492 isoform X2 n=1 Tax=Setaria italica TaxID=4555 RepID=UPI000350D97D|nr:uncharacterized protein LOC101768492 isoform X2 [Setaria italica]